MATPTPPFRLLSPADPGYPEALRATSPLAPPPLWVRGDLPADGVALVGSRDADDDALDHARTLARQLAGAGLPVWSGGARGIDAAAHRGALGAGAAPTVVVLATGIDRVYPPEHAGLFAEIVAAGGALVTPFAPGDAPARWHFHRRNHLLATLTRATILVGAGFASGARSTVRAARWLGRPVGVVPQPPWDPRGQGAALELARGARALYGFADTLAWLAGEPPGAGVSEPPRGRRARPPSPPALAPEARAVWEALPATGPQRSLHVDQICERTRLPYGEVAAALLTLTLQAVVVEALPGYYRRST